MRLKAAFKFEVREFVSTALAVYGVMMLINIIGIILNLTTGGGFKTNMTLNGAEMVLLVTIFVLAVSGFGENFQMLMQNGVSRKNIFICKVCAGALYAVTLSITDRVFLALTKFISNIAGVNKSTESMWNQIYPEFAEGNSAILTVVAFTLLSIAAYLLVYMLGTAISGIFYRLGKTGRTVFSIALPVTAFVLLPLMLEIFWETAAVRWLIKAMVDILGLAKGIPYPAAVTLAVLFGIFGAASWAVIRRAIPKE